MSGVEDLGKRLLEEVEECGFDEILQSLRLRNSDPEPAYFNFTHLDRPLRTILDAKQLHAKTTTTSPVVELTSLAPGGGKPHLLAHLCALAVLPTALNGKQACVIIIDTDGNLSIPRLAKQIELLVRQRTVVDRDLSDEDVVSTALNHIHIFRPQTLASTIATLDCLPAYLFNRTRHSSFDRQVAFIALDSATAFYWQDRAEVEDANFLAATTGTSQTGTTAQSAYTTLNDSLKNAYKSFNCAAVVSTWHLGPVGANTRSLRPAIPAFQPTLRLIVQRKTVWKFPPGISVDAALREKDDRWKAVAEGKFEGFVNEWGLDERLLRKLGDSAFSFRILQDGLLVEEES